MTKASKKVKVLITLVLLALAFFCSFNVTVSYFTATAKESGTINFSDLDVRFVAAYEDDEISGYYPDNAYDKNNSYTINLYPVGGTIARGQEFELSLSESGDAIQDLMIQNMEYSSTAYVRFWIDAYIVTSTTTNDDGSKNYVLDSTNYGKYFFFSSPFNFVRGGSNAEATEGDWCYYVDRKMFPINYSGEGITEVSLGNTLTMKDIVNGENVDAVPNDVLGSQMKISITLEAVQTEHQAFKSVFKDKKGYYNNSDRWN